MVNSEFGNPDNSNVEGISDGWFREDLIRMNDRFIAAMGRAIRERLERPPRVGIDTTPGTRNPTLVRPVVLPHNGSHMSDIAGMGDGGLTGLVRRAAPISLAGRADSAKR
jgi:hypothetical protein